MDALSNSRAARRRRGRALGTCRSPRSACRASSSRHLLLGQDLGIGREAKPRSLKKKRSGHLNLIWITLGQGPIRSAPASVAIAAAILRPWPLGTTPVSEAQPPAASIAPGVLSREGSAAYVSVSPVKFGEMVDNGTMPQPRHVGATNSRCYFWGTGAVGGGVVVGAGLEGEVAVAFATGAGP
jgi:hypothetical protein